MQTKLRLVLSIPLFFFCLSALSQERSIYWEAQSRAATSLTLSRQTVSTSSNRVFRLRENSLRSQLQLLQQGEDKVLVSFPNALGGFDQYWVREQSVMAPELQRQYPGIRSYVGYSTGEAASRIRFSVSHKGMQGMIVQPGEQTLYLERSAGSSRSYLLFSREGLEPGLQGWTCKTDAGTAKAFRRIPGEGLIDDQQLRTYRLAVATTGEYAQYHGGTVPDALAAINATMTRVNEVFERDMAIRMELIQETSRVIYTDPNTDPFGGNLSSEVQTTLDARIGSSGYDIGHLFHQAGENGNAGFIGAVCVDGRKGSAFASTPTPEGDRFDLDFVAHEMGHQFGANHTWSFQTEGTGVQAEPGSGTTIMGYAGITQNNDVQTTGDDYFHYYSIFQMRQYVLGTSCASLSVIDNTPPEITPLPDFSIPKGTAFVLEGAATDPNPGDVLTYSWEQVDDGVVTRSSFGPDNPAGANFRSRRPVSEPTRFFPLLSRVASGNLTQTDPPTGSAWETVANVERDLNFALTVRDNAEGGGQLSSDLVRVRVEEEAGPFRVLSQSAPEEYEIGSVQTVTWDVAGTNSAPINTQLVDIYLSSDGGLNFPNLIAEDLPNTGTAQVQIPRIPTPFGRFMVRASDQIYFAVNDSDFTLNEQPFLLYFEQLKAEVCQPDNAVFEFTYQTFGGFDAPVALDVSGVPPGLTALFSTDTVQVDGSQVSLAFTGTEAVAPGSYALEVSGTDGSTVRTVPIILQLVDSVFTETVLLFPEDRATEVNLNPEFLWSGGEGDQAYDLELAADPSFTNPIVQRRIHNTRYRPGVLEEDTEYFWRIRPVNPCGEGSFSPPFSFRTINSDCKTLSAAGLPIVIPSTGTPVITSVIAVTDNQPVLEVKVNLDVEHSFVSDLIISLTSPSGTKVTLVSNNCGEANDINATFQDDAPPFACSNNPAISGVVRPLGSLDAFAGESSFGEWVLTVEDTAPADGGSLNSFSLELCVEGEFRPDADEDGVFDDGDDLCLGTPPGAEVDANGCEVFRFPENRFLITAFSESCIGLGDGRIVVAATEPFDYTLEVQGDNTNISDSFTNTYEVEGLADGTYTVCVGGTDGTNLYETQCFEVTVESPAPLSVVAFPAPDYSSVALKLEGSEFYVITLNGRIETIQGSAYTLELDKGYNQLKVEGLPACKGEFQTAYVRSDEPLLAPNPFTDAFEIRGIRPDQPAEVNIFDLSGTLVWSVQQVPREGNLVVRVPGLPSGLYIVEVSQGGMQSLYKIQRQ